MQHVTSSVPNLRIIQLQSGAERRDRLASDLEMLGLPKAALSVGAAVAFANEHILSHANYERYGFSRVLSMQMEAGDAHIDNARKAMAEHDPKSEDVDQIITEFLRSNASDFDGVAVPEQKKGLFGRLFG